MFFPTTRADIVRDTIKIEANKNGEHIVSWQERRAGRFKRFSLKDFQEYVQQCHPDDPLTPILQKASKAITPELLEASRKAQLRKQVQAEHSAYERRAINLLCGYPHPQMLARDRKAWWTTSRNKLRSFMVEVFRVGFARACELYDVEDSDALFTHLRMDQAPEHW